MQPPSQLLASVDGELLDIAERDLFRALIVQNSRVAQRFDPVGRYRTHKVEGRLRTVGLVLCVVAVFLSLLLLAIGWLLRGEVSVIAAGFLVLTVALLAAFRYLHNIRQWGIERLDRTLERRAAGQLAALREAAPLTLRYVVENGSVRCEHVEGENVTVRFERPLSASRYALIGDRCIALFPTPRKQNPNVIVLVAGDPDKSAWQDILRHAGLEVETLQRELVPTTTIERAW